MNNDRKRAAEIVAALEKIYPDAECALRYEGEPWRLLVMAILSAQCTDARVNLVSEGLFAHFPNAAAMGSAELCEIEADIKSCGLYHMKAKNIRESSAIIAETYGGAVPDELSALLALPGVGRKIANLILGDVYGKPAIVTDTHCIRLAGRLGFCPEDEKNPLKIERILSDIIEPEKQSDFCHRLVLFGRQFCTARSPKCDSCPIKELCGRNN